MIGLVERKRLRREYLWKKAKAHVNLLAGWSALLVTSSVAILLMSSLLLLALGAFHLISIDSIFMRNILLHNREACGTVYLAFTSICAAPGCGLAVWASSRKIGQAAEEVAHLTYVPPVIPSTLSAAEILVRGSEAEVFPDNTVLLRVATMNAEMPKEQLLRAQRSEDAIDSRQ